MQDPTLIKAATTHVHDDITKLKIKIEKLVDGAKGVVHTTEAGAAAATAALGALKQHVEAAEQKAQEFLSHL